MRANFNAQKSFRAASEEVFCRIKKEASPEMLKSTEDLCKSDLTTIAQGASITFAGKVFSAVIQYIHLIVISRILGVRMLGGVLLGMTIISLAGLISRLGLDLGIVKFVAQYLGNKDFERAKGIIATALLGGAFSGFFMALLLCFNADILVRLFGDKSGLKEFLSIVGATLPFSSIMWIALAATQGAKRIQYSAYTLNIAMPLINLTGVALFYSLGVDALTGIISAFVLATLSANLLSIFFLVRTFSGLKKVSPIFEPRQLFSVSMPLGLVTFLSCIVLWTDTIMLGCFRSSAEVGIYNTAMKTALLTSLILFSFNGIFAPLIAELYHQQKLSRLKTLFKVVAKWIFVISLPIYFLMTLLAGEIMSVFGGEFSSGVLPLRILVFIHLINAAVGSAGYMLAMSGRQKMVMYNTIFIFFFNILLNFYLIPLYGIAGAAVATGIATILVNCIMLVEVHLLFRVFPFSLNFIPPLMFGAIIFAGLAFVKTNISPPHLAIQFIMYPAIYLIVFGGMIYKWSIAAEDQFIIEIIKSKLQSANLSS